MTTWISNDRADTEMKVWWQINLLISGHVATELRKKIIHQKSLSINHLEEYTPKKLTWKHMEPENTPLGKGETSTQSTNCGGSMFIFGGVWKKQRWWSKLNPVKHTFRKKNTWSASSRMDMEERKNSCTIWYLKTCLRCYFIDKFDKILIELVDDFFHQHPPLIYVWLMESIPFWGHPFPAYFPTCDFWRSKIQNS